MIKISAFKLNDNIKNSPFKNIIYLFKNKSDILIEDVETQKVWMIKEEQIKKYIKVKSTDLDWIQLPDKSFIYINCDIISQIVPLFNNVLQYVNLEFKFSTTNSGDFIYEKNIKKIESNYNIRSETTKNFKLNFLKNNIKLLCKIPLYKTFIEVTKYREYVSCKRIFIVINGKIYKYPYGNVSNNGNVCLGDGSEYEIENTSIDLKDHFYSHIVNRIGNNDYLFNLEISKTEIPSFNLENIKYNLELKIKNHLFDVLYYLSNVDKNNIDISIFKEDDNFPEYVSETIKEEYDKNS